MLEDWGKTGSACNYTAIGSKKLNKKLREIVIRTGMFCKLVA